MAFSARRGLSLHPHPLLVSGLAVFKHTLCGCILSGFFLLSGCCTLYSRQVRVADHHLCSERLDYGNILLKTGHPYTHIDFCLWACFIGSFFLFYRKHFNPSALAVFSQASVWVLFIFISKFNARINPWSCSISFSRGSSGVEVFTAETSAVTPLQKKVPEKKNLKNEVWKILQQCVFTRNVLIALDNHFTYGLFFSVKKILRFSNVFLEY